MISWWQHLSCSAATVVAIIALSVAVCAWIVGINWLRATLGGNRRAIPPREHNGLTPTDFTAQRKSDMPPPWPLVDYTGKRQEKLDWLGDDGLMARPVTRIQGSHEVGRVVQFERKR